MLAVFSSSAPDSFLFSTPLSIRILLTTKPKKPSQSHSAPMLTTCPPSPRSLCLVVPWASGKPASLCFPWALLPEPGCPVPRFLQCWWSQPVQSLYLPPTGPASVSSGDLGPCPFTSQASLSPFVKWERSWEKTGCDRQEVFLSDWTALPNSPVGEMGTRMGTGSDLLTDVFCCHAVRVPPKAFQGIWSPKRRLPVGGQLSSPLAGHTAEAAAGPHLQAYGIRGVSERGRG